MKHIEINIGKACNNKCRFCMSARVGEDEKQLTAFDIVKHEIHKYAHLGYTSIGFLGGDISIHPRIYEILAEAKKSGFQVINIITNAMVFSNLEKAKKLVASGVTRINISIHSHLDEVEDYITQIQGGLQKKFTAIDHFNALHKVGLLPSPLSVNIVLNKTNMNTLLETCIYFYRVKNIKDIRINFMWPRFFYAPEDREKMMLSYEEILPLLSGLIHFSLKYNVRITFDSIPACILYKIDSQNYASLVARFLGEDQDHITEISNLNMGTIFDWKQQKTNVLKKKFKSCHACLYYKTCQGVWKEYIIKYQEKEFLPIIH